RHPLRGSGVHADDPARERGRAARRRVRAGDLRPLRRGAREPLRPREPWSAGRARRRPLGRARRPRPCRAPAARAGLGHVVPVGGAADRLRPRGAARARGAARRPAARRCRRGAGGDRRGDRDDGRAPGVDAARRPVRNARDRDRRGGLMATQALDPITTEIIRSAFAAAADEMNAILIRSAYTPIIYEMKDCSVALLDAEHRVLGQSAGLPIFLGNLEICTRRTEEMYGREGWEPGDVWIMNDSYITGT